MNKENKPLRLLIVEDNHGDQILLKKYLQRTTIPTKEILWAKRLSDVADMLQEREPDLVFLDLSLPDSNGIDSFVALNKLITYTPIIVLSGLSDLDAATEAISLGAQDYLMKGEFDEKLLAKSVQYSIERKKNSVILEESNKRYEIVNKATGDVIWDWNLKTGEIYMNDKLMDAFGYEEQHLSIDWFFERLHPEDREEVKDFLSHCVENGIKSWEKEYRFCTANGDYKNAFARGYILFDNAGDPYRMIGSVTDVTERKRLEEELIAQKLYQQKLIAETAIQAQEKLREELSKELHDNINQVLATVKMFLDIAKRDETMRMDLINRSHENTAYAIEEIRRLSKSLVAPTLGDIGLMGALQDLANDLNFTKGIAVELNYDGFKEEELDSGLKLMFYRIVQEQTNNIIKYAKASKADISLGKNGNHMTLSIADNGIGFNPKQKANGIGLRNIGSRVEFYSGQMDVIYAPGEGCVLKVTIPVSNEQS